MTFLRTIRLRACLGKVLGAFALYFDEPRTPTSLEQSLIELFTHIASIAVERAQSDASLKRSEAFLPEAQHLSSIGSYFWRAATDEITWSEETYRRASAHHSFRDAHSQAG